MKKIYIVVLLFTSLLLSQCYTQYQYTPEEYNYGESNELIYFTMKDSTILKYEADRYKFGFLSDSVLVVFKATDNPYDYDISKSDTVNLNNVLFLTVSEANTTQTVLLAASILFVTFILLGVLMPKKQDGSPFFDKGTF